MENESIFCPQCGTKNAATSSFCFACGTPLSRAKEPPKPEPPKPEPPKPEPNEFDAPTEVLDPSEFPDLLEPSATPESAFRPAELNEFDAPTEVLDQSEPFAPPEDVRRPAEQNASGAPTEVLGQGDFANPLESSEPAPRSVPNEFDVPMGGFGQDGFTDPIEPSATPETTFRPAAHSVRKAFAGSAAAIALTLLTVFACAMLFLTFESASFRTVTELLPEIFDEIGDVFDEAPLLLLWVFSYLLDLVHTVFLAIVLLGAWLVFLGASQRGRGMQTGGLIVVRIGVVVAFLASFLKLAIFVVEMVLESEWRSAFSDLLNQSGATSTVSWVLSIASTVLLPVLYLMLFHTAGGMKRVVRTENPRERVSLVVPSVTLLLYGILQVVGAFLQYSESSSFDFPITDGTQISSTLSGLDWVFALILAVGVFVLAGYLLQLRVRLKRSSTAE